MGTHRAKNVRVLIVEDESIIAGDIAISLEQMGYKVIGSEVSGASAINTAANLRPDIVLMDIVLQDEMDGIEAASFIRQELNIPVIYLSAYAEEKILDRAKHSNPFGYLIKPFDSNELHFSIQMGLYKFRIEEELKQVNRSLRTISQCNHALVRAGDEDALLRDICRIIVTEGDYSLAAVAVPGADADNPRMVHYGADVEAYDFVAHLGGQWLSGAHRDDPLSVAMRSGMPISLVNIGEHEGQRPGWMREATRLGMVSCMALPLLSGAGTLGVLGIFSRRPGTLDSGEYDMVVDLAGNLAYWIISIRNRKAHEAAEIALQASHERFIAVMDSIDAIVYVSDMGTNELLFANKFVKDQFEYSDGKACWAVFQGADQDGPCSFCTNRYLVDDRGEPVGIYHWEYRNQVTGSWYDIRDRAIRWVDGRVVRLEIATDITTRKEAEVELKRHRERLEELVEERTLELTVANRRLQHEISVRRRAEEELIKAQKLESMGILAGGIAHDFNNILTSLLSNISLAKLYVGESHEAFAKLMSAEKTTLRARDLTQQLLTFSKSGVPVKKTSSIIELLKDSAEFTLMGSSVKISYDIQEGVSSIEADEAQIGQVISNLMINAVQAMPGGGRIQAGVSNVDIREGEILAQMKGRYVKLTIADTGVGIPKENLSKIFDPYFTTKKGGSGLGLASTYSIIKKHDGFIFVKSEPGVGTTFEIYLPASDKPAVKETERKERLIKGSGRVLILDDDIGIRESIGEVLRFLGYETEFTADGYDTVEVYAESLKGGRPFDALIMDLTVPGGMGGLQALELIRRVNPEVKGIVSSGYSNDPIMSNYSKYGFKGVINKPYRIDELSRVLSEVIKG